MKHAKQGLAALLLALVMALGLGLVACGDKETTEYTVTFDSNGGSAVASVTVKENGKVTEPTAPTKENYVFGGWFKDSECTEAWVFATDTVQGDITLYAKWTPVQAVAGEIGWVKPAAGSVIIPSDYGKYNPAYRKTLEEFAPDVYATEDGEKIATIITDADELTYGEDGMLTAGDYTVTYTARDSVGDDHEETFTVKVVDAEESNYYVYVKTVGTAYADPKWEEILGKRIRVAADRYFESADGTLPEALINPHDPTLIVDFDDAYILKNASDNELTVRLSDKSGVYAVFDETGKVVYGVDGFQNKGISADWKYENTADGYTQKDTITLPAHSYLLAVGNSPLGNWYFVPDAPSWNPAETNLTAYRRDGRAFVFNSVATRYGNMVQLKRGSNVLTGAYVNQAPYMTKGYKGFDILRSDDQLSEEELTAKIMAEIAFADDNGTFTAEDDIVVATENININQQDLAAIDNTVEQAYTVRIEVTDSTDNAIKEQFSIIVTVADKYLKIGNAATLANPTVVINAKLTASAADGKMYVWTSAALATDIAEQKYNGCAIVNKHTGKIIAAADWSNYIDHTGTKKSLTDGMGATFKDGAYSARQLFTWYMTDEGRKLIGFTGAAKEDLILINIVQPNHSTIGAKFIAACTDYGNAYVEIKGLAGLGNTTKPNA